VPLRVSTAELQSSAQLETSLVWRRRRRRRRRRWRRRRMRSQKSRRKTWFPTISTKWNVRKKRGYCRRRLTELHSQELPAAVTWIALMLMLPNFRPFKAI